MFQAKPECIPCFQNQIIRTANLQQCSPEDIKNISQGVDQLLEEISFDNCPPYIAGKLFQYLEDYTGEPDPYAEIKSRSTEWILSKYDQFKKMVEGAKDPLKQAILFAGMGNAIDYGADPNFRLEDAHDILSDIPVHIFEYQKFIEKLDTVQEVLYLADNVGETILDRLLIETLGKKVTYVVKSHPIINDALYEDAAAAGIDQVAEIIESGTSCPGTVLHTCSPEFQERFNHAELILSKGQGNYEALIGESAPIFFLLKVKCKLVADHLQAPKGSMIFKENI